MSNRERFTDSEYLRRVLMRLLIKGSEAWRTDPEAEELLLFAIERFSSLCIKYGLEPDDAGSAAFEAMRNPSVVFGHDPWAVIVHAVRTTLAAWEFANDALCSVETARRGGLSGCCPVRFSDRENQVWEYHPSFIDTGDDDEESPYEGLTLREQAEQLTSLFHAQGWPAEETLTAIEVILHRLADAGSRPAAYEQLRREKRWRVITELPAESWTGLLRLLLGNPTDWAGVSDKGRGILLRVALGETIEDLASDVELTKGIRLVTPGKQWVRQ